MLVGKKVKIDNPVRIRDFYSKYRVISDIPVQRGHYIYVSYSGESIGMDAVIYVVKKGWDVDLTDKKQIIEFLDSKRKLSKKDLDYFSEEKDLDVLWNKIRAYYHFGIVDKEEESKSVYNLFCALIKSDKEIFQAYNQVNAERELLFSSLLTMLIRSQSYRDYQGTINPYYLEQLKKTNQVLRNVKLKTMQYVESSRSEIDLLWYLFSLKRG